MLDRIYLRRCVLKMNLCNHMSLIIETLEATTDLLHFELGHLVPHIAKRKTRINPEVDVVGACASVCGDTHSRSMRAAIRVRVCLRFVVIVFCDDSAS